MQVKQTTQIDPNIFRAYDIRGIVGQTLTAEGVFLIGQALGSLVQEMGENQIAVARDGRHSGPLLLRALTDGLLATGCHVIDLGMVPTPVLYYATHILDQHSGVVLTGSHNPAEYNGLKMVVKGVTLSEEAIQALYQRIVEARFLQGTGTYQVMDLTERYVRDICQDVCLAHPLRIVVDAGSGVTGQLAPALFRTLGCDVHELYCDIDGSFPYHHADPSQVDNLQDLIRVVHETAADIGLAFDGDGDRLGVVTRRGEIIWPDRLLMLYAQALLSEQAGAKVIYDVKCTQHLETHVRALGGEPLMWKTGHSLIKTKMKEIDAQLAGEMSGHFFFKDRWHGGDDALYAGARLLEILARHKEDIDAVFDSIPNSVNTPELKVYIAEDEKFTLMRQLIDKASFQQANQVTTIDGLRVNFDEGWGLVRPSNTSPYLVLRFEAKDESILDNIQRLFREWMLSVRADLILPF